MAIDYAMGILTLKYDSLLRSASSPCQVVATDFNRKTESVDLGNVMVPGDILQFEGMDLERIPHTSSTTLTWQSIITRQEHIKFIGVYWIHYVPASLDGRHTGYHVGVPDLWCIIRFYPWSSIIKLPFELVILLVNWGWGGVTGAHFADVEAMAWIPSQGAALQHCATLVWVFMEGSSTQEDGWELHFVRISRVRTAANCNPPVYSYLTSHGLFDASLRLPALLELFSALHSTTQLGWRSEPPQNADT
ncbi:uncharacterized protein LACBIDRAFT_326320 [Laccaria bicolor S238N-H82]|uniref:Predicted protein n=1 Tax=Laccaria bicolor (strain S238N-H82 / ATCC MYA-4686) TaxID=486041 RepID=B0D816_LACBS|nr:uncharacterized protein LACBIDRAFT_326320 [Laccaria bicolor S238N-H82]EDR09742.1 predicted protein [Laccaria bicolor S238N-H82]|eukprot:XP_001880091.1 predicted protein [Laccaria bicolor S238N-H82]